MVLNIQPYIAEPLGLQNVRCTNREMMAEKIVEGTLHSPPAWATQKCHGKYVAARLEIGERRDEKTIGVWLFCSSKWVKTIRIPLTEKLRDLLT